MQKRMLMRMLKAMNRTMSTMKKILPMVSRPRNLNGCCARRVARAPVDMVHSNQAQVKWLSLSRIPIFSYPPPCFFGAFLRPSAMLAMLTVVPVAG